MSAVWAYRNRRAAGRYTDTLASSQCFHVPLLTVTRAWGVLAVCPVGAKVLSLDERDLLESFAQQIAIVLEKESLRSEAETARILGKSDQLHQALFNSVSHELQTPLAVLQGGLDELQGEPGRAGTIVAAMSDAMERLKRLVKNLLDSARLESGRLDLHREWGQVRDVVDQAVEICGETLRPAKLAVDLRADLPLVHVDFGLLSQALANILHNAVVHGSPPVTITITAQTDSASLALHIQDNGPGIAPELQSGIFDRFVRAPSAKPGGSGLGLAISKGFVEAHGGTIEVKSVPGHGSTFTVRLPLEKAPDSIRMDV